MHSDQNAFSRRRRSSTTSVTRADSFRPQGKTSLALRGQIRGADLGRLADALGASTKIGTRSVTIDVSALTSWSLVAQAMVLLTARSLERGGGHLVLVGPTAALRLQSAHMDLFGRVRTLKADPTPMPTAHTKLQVALLAIHQRQAVLIRRHDEPVLRLPGGSLDDGENHQESLARHVSTQLGHQYDGQTFESSEALGSLTAREAGHRLRTVCYQPPDPPRHENGASELVGATHQTSGIYTPTAHNALNILHRSGHIA